MSYSHVAKCKFQPASWLEKPYADIDGEGTTMGDNYYPKRGLTHAEVGFTYHGDVEGASTLAYLIAYKDGAAAPVLGFERFEGSIGGHEGSCVFQFIGNQDAGSVRGHVETVPGMGTGGLSDLRGEAELEIAGHAEDGYELVLHYDLG
ncbi:MAG: DUF3224 domain-containing protein [Nocardioidaceae bacterium]